MMTLHFLKELGLLITNKVSYPNMQKTSYALRASVIRFWSSHFQRIFGVTFWILSKILNKTVMNGKLIFFLINVLYFWERNNFELNFFLPFLMFNSCYRTKAFLGLFKLTIKCIQAALAIRGFDLKTANNAGKLLFSANFSSF